MTPPPRFWWTDRVICCFKAENSIVVIQVEVKEGQYSEGYLVDSDVNFHCHRKGKPRHTRLHLNTGRIVAF